MALEQLQEELEEQTKWMGKPPEAERKGAEPAAFLRSIPVKLQVMLGSVETTVAQLSEVSPGTVLDLDKRIGDPVDLVVNNTLIGTAQLIATEDDAGYGLRILSLNSELGG